MAWQGWSGRWHVYGRPGCGGAVLTLGEWVHEGLVSGRDRRVGLLWLANFGVALGKLEANRLRQVRVEPNTLL